MVTTRLRSFSAAIGLSMMAGLATYQPSAAAYTNTVENGWSTGWDWDGSFKPETYGNDLWRYGTLDWAQRMDPDHPSFDVVKQISGPPPREPWCSTFTQPNGADCANFNLLLSNWVRSYLELPAGSPLPVNMPIYPKGCPSACPNL